MKTKTIMLSLIVFLTSITIGWADVVATWQMRDGALTRLSVRDEQHVRIDTREKDTYMLLRNGKVYMVRKEGGQWSAFDMEQMAGMMQRFAGGSEGQPAPQDFQWRFNDSGRVETIAGYKGNVYEIEYTDANGQSRREEVVLSRHPDIIQVNRGWVVFASRMAQMLGRDSARQLDQSLKTADEKGYGGLLRYGRDLVLQKVEKPSLSVSHYQLPEGVRMMEMPTMEGGPTASGSATPTQRDGFAEETVKKSEEAAKDETQKSIVEGVREGVKGMFKKVW